MSVFSEAERKVCGGVNYTVNLLDISLWNLKYDIFIIFISDFFCWSSSTNIQLVHLTYSSELPPTVYHLPKTPVTLPEIL